MNHSKTIKGITAHLERGSQELPSRVTQKLAQSRQFAVARATQQERLARNTTLSTNGNASTMTAFRGGGELHGHPGRLMFLSLLIGLAILALTDWNVDSDDDYGLLDAKLLSSEIPPQTFAQKDFGVWLQETR